MPFILYSQSELTLQKAIERTLQNNYNIRIVKKDVQIADNNLSYGNSGFLPSLDLSGTYKLSGEDTETKTEDQTYPGEDNRSKSLNGSVSLGWTLFDGFAMFARYDKFEDIKKLNEITLQLEIESRLQELFDTFYQIVMVKENIQLLEETLKFSQERVDFLKSSNIYGASTGTEVLIAEVDYNNDFSTLKRQNVSLNTALNKLKYIMGETNDENFEITSTIEVNDLDEYSKLKDMAFERNSTIRQAIANRKISELDEKLIEAAYYPNIKVSAGYSNSQNTSDKGFILESSNIGYNASINASWNIFDGFKTSIADENAKINTEKQDIYIQNIRAVIAMNLKTNYDAFTDLKEILALENQNAETSKESFERSKSMFKYGSINALELRQSQVNLLEAKQRIANLKYEIKTYETAILMLTGQLGG